MKQRFCLAITSIYLFAMLTGLVLTFSTGCQNIIRRAQSPDELVAKDDEKRNYVGKIAKVWGLNYAKVEGIGLAVNLKGTGSNPKASGQVDALKRELDAREISDISNLIADKETSMVLMRGYLPPGIRKGEPFDVEVGLMPDSETTSLERGFVLKTSMRPIAKLGRSVKHGALSGFAEGQVMVNSLFENRGEKNARQGWIYGGGISAETRPLGLTIVAKDTSVQLATAIATSINRRYTVTDKSGRRGSARPKTDRRIELTVPSEYRLNISRFLQGVMNVVYGEDAKTRANRLDVLDRQMGSESTAEVAAIRLEAMGSVALPALKRAIKHTHPKVRFFAAQALAYLGEHDGTIDLEETAANDPIYRWQALTALSAIEHSSARDSLARLLHAKGAETRYGAFSALKARDRNDPLVTGQKLAHSFTLHEIESDTDQPLIHFSRSKSPEVVVFGSGQEFQDGFMYIQPGLTIKKVSPTNLKVTSYAVEGGGKWVCDNNVSALVKLLAKAGYGYGTVVRVFREADRQEALSGRFAINAVPNAKTTVKRKQELALTGSGETEKADVPDLYRNPKNEESEQRREWANRPVESKPGMADRLKSMFTNPADSEN